MRFSAWSLRVISACSAFLFFAAPASAHLSVSPTKVAPGAAVDLTFAAPNASLGRGVDHVVIHPPIGFAVDDAEAKPGWTQTRTLDGSLTWTGGDIPEGQFATFTIRGDAPGRTGRVTFNVLVGDHTGKSITYRVALDVAGSSRDWGKPALILAIAAGLLALAAFFVGLAVWLRPPR